MRRLHRVDKEPRSARTDPRALPALRDANMRIIRRVSRSSFSFVKITNHANTMEPSEGKLFDACLRLTMNETRDTRKGIVLLALSTSAVSSLLCFARVVTGRGNILGGLQF